jgi:hypothetical protein
VLHATNCSLILDDCLDDDEDKDSAFRALVERGVITFCARPGVAGPQEMLEMMLSRGVYLGAWEREIIDYKAAREAALRYLQGRSADTGMPAVNRRIKRAKRLFQSIQVAAKRFGVVEESEYTAPFQSVFELRVRSLPEGLSPQTRILLNEIGGEKSPHENRSAVYREIERRQPDEAIATEAKAFVDTITDALVAESLRLPLHSLSKFASSRFAHRGATEEGELVEIAQDEIRGLTALALGWPMIERVTRGFPAERGPAEVEKLLDELAQQLAAQAITAPALGAGAAEGVFSILVNKAVEAIPRANPSTVTVASASTGLTWLAFGGPFGTALLAAVVTALGTALAGRVAEGVRMRIQARKVERAKRLFRSFYDKLPPGDGAS